MMEKEEIKTITEIAVYRSIMNNLRDKILENHELIKKIEYENRLYEKVLKDIRTHTKQLSADTTLLQGEL